MVATGNTEPATHNAIGKIYITLNRDPVNFLKNNQFYDPKGPSLRAYHISSLTSSAVCRLLSHGSLAPCV
jgi:hypothetical protein